MILHPFIIPLTFQACTRKAILEGLAWEGTRDPTLLTVAQQIAASTPADWHARADAALRWVHTHLRYFPDRPGVEEYAPVPWVLSHGGDDCDGLSVVLAALCWLLGVPCEIVWVTQQKLDKDGRLVPLPQNHVSVMVGPDSLHLETWAEASVAGAYLGESPYDAIVRLPRHRSVVF